VSARDAFERLKTEGVLPEVIAEIEEHVRPGLESYVEDRGPGRGPGENKALKDAIWGMIDLEGSEIVVLDSPPLQRLRRIRQLGLAYLTYPTAGYSRFEHTLGAVNQSERMLRAIARRSEEPLRPEIAKAARVVRLAALLHDIGHMPLSHISERYYTDEECTDEELLANAKAIQGDLANAFQAFPGVNLAECLSVAIIGTPSFTSLLRDEARYTEEEIARAALAIAGKAADPGQLFVAQIISNVIDADKLDYMFRDSFVTRVPLAVDLERLLYKLMLAKVDVRMLPESRGFQVGDQARVLATDVAGDRLAYEVTEAKELLFSRVYFHHKTRAAERVALRILDRLKMRPAELLPFDDSLFGHRGQLQYAEQAEGLIGLLMERRLPRRGFAISPTFLDRQISELRVQWATLSSVLDSAAARQALEGQIEEECRFLAEKLGKSPPDGVWVDLPAEHPKPGESSLLVKRPGGDFERGQGFPPDAAAETQDPLDLAHIFFTGGHADAELVFVACQRVLGRNFGLFFEGGAADHAKVEWDRAEELKRRLEEAAPESFAELGQLRSTSTVARDAALDGQITALAERFHHFNTSPPVAVNADRIREFLDQFPETLVEPMLGALERITYLSRGDLGQAFARELKENAAKGAVLVPLTAQYDKSAAHIPYFLSDLAGGLNIVKLEEALESDSPIVVFDDVLVSGTQSRKILETWFDRRKHPYREQPVLTAEQQQALKERQVDFHFAWAWKVGIERLEELAEELGLEGEVRADAVDDSGSPLEGHDRLDELRGFLAEVGAELLKTTKGADHGWTEEQCANSALGYDGDERLIVIEYNTPPGTITAIWSPGQYRQADWMPLFPRRQREQN
jgi:HD superfamily phosphohydrolase